VPCGTRPRRPSLPIRTRDGRLPSAPADRAVCDGLPRPPTACLATVRGARSAMLSTDFCFPLLRLRALASHSFPVSLRGLRLAPSSGLEPRRRRLGDLAVHNAGSASAGSLGFARGVFFRVLPTPTAPLTPLSRARGSRFACAKRELRRTCRDHALQAFREGPPTTRSGMPSIASRPRHARVAPTSENGHVKVSARMRVPMSLRPWLRTFVRGAAS
jgi:hypothetical protein